MNLKKTLLPILTTFLLAGCGSAPHVHSSSHVYQYDENTHWHICYECGLKFDYSPHTFIEEDIDIATKHTCNVCGYSYTETKEDELSQVLAVFQGSYVLDHIESPSERYNVGEEYAHYGYTLEKDTTNLRLDGRDLKYLGVFSHDQVYRAGQVTSFEKKRRYIIDQYVDVYSLTGVVTYPANSENIIGNSDRLEMYRYEGNSYCSLISGREPNITEFVLINDDNPGNLNPTNINKLQTVTFIDDELGLFIPSQFVKLGEKVTQPQLPSNEDISIIGWDITDKDGVVRYTEWNFNYYTPYEDTYLKAKYHYKSYDIQVTTVDSTQVLFNFSIVGSHPYNPITTKVNDYYSYARFTDLTMKNELQVDAHVVSDEAIFLGWYSKENDIETLLTEELSYTFTTNKNINIFPKWKYRKYNLILTTTSSSAGNIYKVSGEGRVNDEMIIDVTTNDGYTFQGYYDNNDNLLYPANEGEYRFIMPNHDLVIIAKFTYSGGSSLSFSLQEDDTYVVSAGDAKYLSTIIIPDKYQGKEVTALGDNFFKDFANLKDVYIPKSITKFYNNVFPYESSYPKLVFDNCYYEGNYEEFISLLRSNNILPAYGAFNNLYLQDDINGEISFNNHKYNLFDTLVINEEVVESRAYEHFLTLRHVILTENVKKIDTYAFCSCTNLETLTFASLSQLKVIDSYAFIGTNLVVDHLPDSIKYLGLSAIPASKELGNVTEYDGLYYLGTESNPYFALTEVPKDTDYVTVNVHKDVKCCQFAVGYVMVPHNTNYRTEYKQMGYLGNEENPYLFCLRPLNNNYYYTYSYIVHKECLVFNPTMKISGYCGIYYEGSRQDFIEREIPEDYGIHARVCYYSATKPLVDGNLYWHYNEYSTPTVWE